VQTVQVARQQVITKDNVPVTIDAVLFFKVENASDAIIRVQDFRFAISQYARTSLRDVIGQMTLDQLLAEREQIESAIAKHVEGDKEAAVNLAAAARTMAESPGAMHLRTLQTVDGLGPSASNTVVLAVPVEMMEVVTSLKDALRSRTS
jgi:SPFH domain / Band 7 family